MTPEQLKLSILQSAFQGKLTGECLPNETADDLYWQIQSEKQSLFIFKSHKQISFLLPVFPAKFRLIILALP